MTISYSSQKQLEWRLRVLCHSVAWWAAPRSPLWTTTTRSICKNEMTSNFIGKISTSWRDLRCSSSPCRSNAINTITISIRTYRTLSNKTLISRYPKTARNSTSSTSFSKRNFSTSLKQTPTRSKNPVSRDQVTVKRWCKGKILWIAAKVKINNLTATPNFSVPIKRKRTKILKTVMRISWMTQMWK